MNSLKDMPEFLQLVAKTKITKEIAMAKMSSAELLEIGLEVFEEHQEFIILMTSEDVFKNAMHVFIPMIVAGRYEDAQKYLNLIFKKREELTSYLQITDEDVDLVIKTFEKMKED